MEAVEKRLCKGFEVAKGLPFSIADHSPVTLTLPLLLFRRNSGAWESGTGSCGIFNAIENSLPALKIREMSVGRS